MTIAAGVFSIDGIALACDSKESYGETHTYVDKLNTVRTTLCTAAFAGSGDGYLLDYISPRIVKLAQRTSSGEEFERKLEELLSAIYDSPAVKAYPVEKTSDLYTQFLLAAKFKDDADPVMFVLNSTLVTRATQFGTVIGCGPLTEVGKEIGQSSPFGLERAKEAALCIVYEAKRRYSDVGGNTQIVTIANNAELNWHNEGIVQKESLLDEVRSMTNMITVSTLDSTLSPSRFSGILQNVISKLRIYHREAIKIDKSAGHAHKVWFRGLYKRGERAHRKRQGK